MEFLDFYTGRAFDAYKYLGAHAGAGGTVPHLCARRKARFADRLEP